MKIPIEKRVERFRSFYDGTCRRPLLGYFVGSEYPLFQYRSVDSLPEDRPLRPEDFDPVSFVRDCRRIFEEHESFGGDFIWSACAFWGIPWIEALIGADIYANYQTGSLYAEMSGGDLQPEQIVFDEQNPWAQLCRSFLIELAKESRGDFPLATTRTRGVADILSLTYHGEELIFTMMDDDGSLERLTDAITDLIIDFSRFQLEYIPAFHGGIGSFYYNLWAPKGTMWHQEDATALLSPALYEEFIRPCDERIVKSLGNCIMHQHPTGYMPYRQYVEMGFRALELHIDAGGPSAEQLLPVYETIQASTPLIVWGAIADADLDVLFSRVRPEKLAVCCMLNSREEAERIWKRYIKE